MATLVLTAVGTALGGPLGGAIGAALGQQVDQAVLGAGPAREGPRLKELDVQTSSYGSQIPAVFGAMRVAGTVIWASELIESSSKSSNGKGRPATQNYSYSANLAVALSSRPLQSVGRIWADGNLMRGAAGDFKTQTEFRFYSGYDDQVVDPLLASAETMGQIPAHRGLAYVVFEGLQLANFGNRIPSLTFEIFERSAPVLVEEIASELSNGVVTGNSNVEMVGYAATGRDARAAISPLLDAMPVHVETLENGLRMTSIANRPIITQDIEIAVTNGSTQLVRGMLQTASIDTVPGQYSVRYYEPLRDYQTGIQTSDRLGGGHVTELRDLPAAIDAPSAKFLAEMQLARLQRQRVSWTGNIADGATRLRTGDWIQVPGDAVALRIVEIEQQRGYMQITAVQSITAQANVAQSTDPGRHLPDKDLPVGVSHLVAMDLPSVTTAIPHTPMIALAVAGSSPGWRGAALLQTSGEQYSEISRTTTPAVMGFAVTKLRPHSVHFFDKDSALEIDLLHAGMELPLAPLSGLCWIEGEIIRYRNVEALSETRYRLTGFERGLFDTAAKMADHSIGDRFVLLENDSISLVDVNSQLIGQDILFGALGLGDQIPVGANVQYHGVALRPRSPVHGRLSTLADGSAKLTWIRRARVDFGWVDGVDHPVAEDRELYEVALINAVETVMRWTLESPELVITAAQWTTLAAPIIGQAIFEIRQIGRHALSAPLIISI